MTDASFPRLPESFEGMRVGSMRRSAGRLAVYAATDRLDLPVELHVVQSAALPTATTPESFVALLRRAADVRHEALLTYVTGGRSGDLLFAVAKTQDAAGLDEVLARGGGLAEDRVAGIGVAIAGALATLERAKLRHGDLTPKRVLLPGRGQVLLGPPRLVPVAAAPRNERYQSPEEARGADGDIRSDLFVLGLILAEALRGEPVLKGPAAEVNRTLADGRVPPDGGVSLVGPALRSILFRLLASDPARRYQTAAQAEQALLNATGGAAAPAAPLDAPVAAPIPVAPAPPPMRSPAAASARPAAPVAPRPVEEERPETAPIDLSVVSLAAALAAPTQAAAPSPPPARPEIDPETIRRPPGRLYLNGRLGETFLEIDESVNVGKPAGNIDIVARPEPFPEAEFRIERLVDTDLLVAIAPGVRLNDFPVTEKGLVHGDRIVGKVVSARYEREARVAIQAAPSGPPVGQGLARAVAAAGAAIAVLGIGIAYLRTGAPRDAADLADATRRQAETAARSAEPRDAAPSAADPKEKAAQDAYERARDWVRTHPEDAAGAAERLRTVADAHPGTGHGALASAEAADAVRRARGAGGSIIDGLLASTRKDAEGGKLDQALVALRTYAEEHPRTVAGERARVHAVQLEAEVLGRFEADVARVETLLAREEPDAALRLLNRMMDYVPDSLRGRTLELRKRAEKGGGPTPPKSPDPPKAPENPPANPPAGGNPPAPPKPGQDEAGGGPTPPADPEKAADTAFRAARRHMDSGHEAEALDAFIAYLRQFKGTKHATKYENEVRSRIQSLSQTAAGIARLFRGKVEPAEKGRYRITYDFADAEQLKDFRDEEAFEAPPRATWKVEGGLVRAPRGSGAFVLDATFTNDSLVTTARVSPDRPHDLGIAYVDASEPRRFYLFMIQNSFFKLGKGPSAQEFRENAIVLFGPGMWRDTPPGQIGFVRKCGSPDPSVRPSEYVELRCGKVEGNVWMKMDGKNQIQGSAYGDIKLEFQGLQPAFFVLNSAGVFDDLVVEGTPDPEWVKTRWRAILSGL